MRARAQQVCLSFIFRSFIVAMIVCNTLATSVDNPYLSATRREQLERIDMVFGLIFFAEACLKLFATGFRDYARSPLNLLDGAMVFVFLLGFLLGLAGVEPGRFFAAMRTFRVLRVFKLMAGIAAFRVLFAKMARAAATVFPMVIMLMVFLFIFAVLSMQMLTGMYDSIYGGVCDDAKPWKLPPPPGAASDAWQHGAAYDAWWRTFDEHCNPKPRWHFDEFQHGFLTVFQVMTCDSWPSIMHDTYNARGGFSFALFPLVIVLGNFVALNLFLAILLAEFSQDGSEEDDDFDAWVRKPEQIAQVSTAYSWMHPAGSAAQHSRISTLLSLS